MGLLPEFTTCCFCFSLQTGSILFGGISMIEAALIAGMNSILLNTYIQAFDDFWDGKTVLIAVFSMEILFCFAYFWVSVFLILGVRRENLRYIKMFIIFRTLMIIYAFFAVSIVLSSERLVMDYYVAVNIFFQCLQAYWTLAVYNHYKQLKRDIAPERHNQQTTYPFIQQSVVFTQAPQASTSIMDSSRIQPIQTAEKGYRT